MLTNADYCLEWQKCNNYSEKIIPVFPKIFFITNIISLQIVCINLTKTCTCLYIYSCSRYRRAYEHARGLQPGVNWLISDILITCSELSYSVFHINFCPQQLSLLLGCWASPQSIRYKYWSLGCRIVDPSRTVHTDTAYS